MLIGDEFAVLPAERVAMPRREIRERHSECAANFCFHLNDLASEPIWREPLGHGVGIKECTIDAIWS
jgi:hypothetical protein